MEFKFRSVHDISPASFSPPSGVGNSSDQQFRGGYRSAEPQGNAAPRDNGEAIQRELEKEKIREELIAAEIARRRVLEAEVRMELMMGRDMVMRRAAESSMSYEERVAMRFDPRYPFIPHPFEDHRWAFPARGAFNALPPPLQLLPEAVVHQPKPEHRKDKIIFLAKPDPSLSGAKHKAKTPPAVGASELSPTISKKKPKEEWSCALCQVRATSEKGLNEHLEGKKHKAKEYGLGARRKAKSFIGKKAEKPTPTEDTGSANSEPGTKLDKVEPNPTEDTGSANSEPVDRLEDVRLWMLHVKENETVGINCVFQLHKTLYNGGAALRDFLGLIRSTSPEIVVMAEQEADHNGLNFEARVANSLKHYSALFDSIDYSLPLDSAARIKIEEMFAREIRNVVSCEGSDRHERHEGFDKWRTMMEQGGFRNVGISERAMLQSQMLLKMYCCENFNVDRRQGQALTLSWLDQNLYTVSAWSPVNVAGTSSRV